MTRIFANRAELMPAGETTDEHKNWQEDEAALIENDRSSVGPKGGLFRGCFRMWRRPIVRAVPIRDDEDGVDRCPRCTWELEDGQCESCGFPDEDAELSESDGLEYYPDDFYNMDHTDDMDDDILEALAEEAYANGHGPMYGEELDSNRSQSIESYYSPPPDRPPPFGYTVTSAGQDYSSLPDTDEDSEDDREVSSLDDFVVDDEEDRHPSVASSVGVAHWEVDEETSLESMQDLDSDIGPISQDDTESHNNGDSFRTAQNNLDEESDEGPARPSRRHLPRISVPSDDSINSEISQAVAAIRNRRQRTSTSRPANGVSRHPRSIPHHSRNKGPRVIEIESDSDSPVPSQRPRRRRPIHNILSSDDETGNEASSGTATVGRQSPRPGPRDQKSNRPQASQSSNASSPILVGSSPTRPENAGNLHPAVPSPFSPPIPLPERSQSALPAIPINHSSNYERAIQPPSPANHGAHSSPQISTTLNHSLIVPGSQRRGNHLQSPPQSRRSRHSPATRISRSPMGAGNRSEQGVRDRRAQKLEKREERRRLKAERERRQGVQLRGSPSVVQ